MSKHQTTIIYMLLLAISFTGCTAKNVVTRVQPHKPSDAPEMNGVFYALPHTVIMVDIPVKQKSQKPGKYQEFAKCFFPDEDVITEEKVSFSVGTPTFNSRGEPDPGQIFMIKIRGRYFEDKTLSLDLTSGGVLTKGESSSTDHSLEIATGALKTFVPIISSLATGVSIAAAGGDKTTNIFTSEQINCLIQNNKLRLKTQAEIDADPNKNADPNKVDNYKSLSNNFEDAKKVYKTIVDLQQARDKFVSGGTTSVGLPADTVKLMLKELDDRIASLKSLFLGSPAEKTWTGNFEYTQDGTDMGKELFEYVDGKDGGVCTTNYSGLNIVDKGFQSKYNCGLAPTKVFLKLVLGKRQQSGQQFYEVVRGAQFNKSGERGYYYRIPAQVTASVEVQESKPSSAADGKDSTDKPILKGQESLAVAQLGEIVSLPASTNGRMTKYTLTLNEATGAMQNFVLGTDALIQSSEVNDVGAAASNIVDTRNKKKAAAAAAKDELTQLERKRMILEEMVKIKEAEDKLNKPTP